MGQFGRSSSRVIELPVIWMFYSTALLVSPAVVPQPHGLLEPRPTAVTVVLPVFVCPALTPIGVPVRTGAARTPSLTSPQQITRGMIHRIITL